MPAEKPATRTERDTLGTVEVPADRYYGAQTARSLHFFAIGDDRMPLPVIRAMGMLKKAAALANRDLGKLPAEPRRPDRPGRRRGDRRQARRSFPAARLADRQRHAVEHERQRGDRQPGQRTGRLAARRQVAGASERSCQPLAVVQRHVSDGDAHCRGRRRSSSRLLPAVQALRDGLATKAGEYEDIIKIGRTHLMDAVPLTLGQEFSGYVAQLDFCIDGHQADAAGALRTGPRRHRGRNRPERSAGFRGEGRRNRSPT